MDPTRGITLPSLILGFPTGTDNMGGSSKFGVLGGLELIHGETWGA